MNDKQINAINYYRNYNKSEKKHLDLFIIYFHNIPFIYSHLLI